MFLVYLGFICIFLVMKGLLCGFIGSIIICNIFVYEFWKCEKYVFFGKMIGDFFK